jgi:EAL and modified HD-GYP domain-containing signal transduction protein
MSTSAFPLLLFKPVADDHDHWVGIHIAGLDAANSDANAALQRMFGELTLGEALPGLAFRLPDAILSGIDRAALPESARLESDSTPIKQAPARPPPSGPASAVLLKLLSQLTSDAETRDIEATLKRDPQLSVQLLRLVNSVAFSPTARITSFAQAINLLGRRQLQRWLQLLMFANQSTPGYGKPLLARAALRAALVENICKTTGRNRETQDTAFIVGMFSLLDVLFGQPLNNIIAPLKLADDVNAALLQQNGPLGDLLTLVVAAETDDRDKVGAVLEVLKVSTDDWCKTQITSLQWTLQITKDV